MRIFQLDETTKSNIQESLLKRSPSQYKEYEEVVNEIIETVRKDKDSALFSYTKKFDRADINVDNFKVTEAEIEYAYQKVDPVVLDVIRKAIKNIVSYHEKQKRYSWFDSEQKGILLGQKITPIAAVGVYVPGGKAAYPSSVLMNVIPAKVAGVERIIMTTPPGADGRVFENT